jgi:hypothetical protein
MKSELVQRNTSRQQCQGRSAPRKKRAFVRERKTVVWLFAFFMPLHAFTVLSLD